MTRPAVLSLLAVLVLGLVACGGGGGKKLSKAEIGKQANSICRKYHDKIEGLSQPARPGDFKGLKTYFDGVLDAADGQHSALKKLKPAGDVESQWKRFIAKDKEGVSLLKKLGKATEKKDTATAATVLTDLRKTVKDTDTAANRAGASGCGGSLSS